MEPQPHDIQVRTVEEAERHIVSLSVRVAELERLVRDHEARFDTLQSSVWRRLLYRLDGWPGQRNLNAPAPAARPWRPWWRS